MNLMEGLRVALAGLVANKLRSGLTMLGVIIGVGAVITMVGMGEGARRDIEQRIKSMGTNLLMVMPGAPRRGPVWGGRGSSDSLKLADVAAIAEKIPTVSQTAPEISGAFQVKYRTRNTNVRITATTPSYPTVRNFAVQKGRFFTEREDRAARRLCTLGVEAAETLFAKRNPLGKQIKIKGIPFTIIGLMEEKGAGFGSPDNQIFIPLTTGNRLLFGQDYVSNINVQTQSEADMEAATQQIERLLRQRHRLRPDQESDFNVRSQTEILSMMQETSKTFTLLLAGIASVSLLVGGIGIMNIMLVSVTERTREIGIRKALGARRQDILLQFLIEAVVLSVIGGLIGISLGLGGARLMTTLFGFKTLTTLKSILVAFCFAGAIGIFFGLYPASKASRLDPIEALRYE